MKKIIYLIIFFFCLQAQALTKSTRMRGYLFNYKGKDFITAKLNTTYPQYEIQWKNSQDNKNLCFSNRPGECPQYTLSFEKVPKRFIIQKAQVIPLYQDPVASVMYLKTLEDFKRKLAKSK